jgi:hypothetical protein
LNINATEAMKQRHLSYIYILFHLLASYRHENLFANLVDNVVLTLYFRHVFMANIFPHKMSPSLCWQIVVILHHIEGRLHQQHVIYVSISVRHTFFLEVLLVGILRQEQEKESKLFSFLQQSTISNSMDRHLEFTQRISLILDTTLKTSRTEVH